MADMVKKFETTLRTDGLFAAMRWLNAQVPYRYSAVFSFDGDLLRNICLIDKKNPKVYNCPDELTTDSYCMFVRRAGKQFSIEQASLDKRLEGHPQREVIQSYYGIPLLGTEGKVLGTVCHFDVLPVPVTKEISAKLDDLGPIICDAAFKPGAGKK